MTWESTRLLALTACCWAPFAVEATDSSPHRSALRLRSDDEVQRARVQYTQLMMMVESEYDQGCQMAAEMFERAATKWSAPDNVTFARIDVERAPKIADALGANAGAELPRYGLSLAGLAKPVGYSGGWSEASIGDWLHRQIALHPVEVTDLLSAARLARDNPHGLLVLGLLTAAQRQRRLLEVAARASDVHAAVAHGDPALAEEFGVDAPCVLIISKHADEDWTMLQPPLTQQALQRFLWNQAMPLVVPIGDRHRAFARHVREHNLRLQVLLVHQSGERGPDDTSERALGEVHQAALAVRAHVLFLSYDFFDNDPDMFTAHGVYQHELPAVLAVHDRGGFKERVWRLPAEKAVSTSSIITLVRDAMIALGSESTVADAGPWEFIAAPRQYPAALEQCSATENGR